MHCLANVYVMLLPLSASSGRAGRALPASPVTASVMERSLTSATRARKISTSCSTSMRVGPGGARIFISTSSRSVSSGR